MPDVPDEFVDVALAAEEQAGVLLPERQQAAIGTEPGEARVAGDAIDRLSLNAADQPLQRLGIVEAAAQVDPSAEAQEATQRNIAVFQTLQQHRQDREWPVRLLACCLTVEAELNLALLPGSDARRAEQDRYRVAAGDRLLELRLPGLTGRQRVAVQEGRDAGRGQARPQRLRPRTVGAAIADEDLVGMLDGTAYGRRPIL